MVILLSDVTASESVCAVVSHHLCILCDAVMCEMYYG